MRPCDDYAPKSAAFQAGYRHFERGGHWLDPLPDELLNVENAATDFVDGWDQAERVDYERKCGEGRP
jgi:hypothetical protein